MKKQETDVKLKLKKQAISKLNKKELQTVKGGAGHEPSLLPTSCYIH
ncbi:bacteriocin [Aquimarina sp. BL5]|nr:class I lanthipeptide [Aquimarina sp. BL5]AXT50631.1 bacteriocin [Aquimarina sp. BL5]RKN07133.1 bacteriocin [Aquimarina sp. BL5]